MLTSTTVLYVVLTMQIFFLIILEVKFAFGDPHSRMETGQTTILFKHTSHGEVWGHYKIHVQMSDIKYSNMGRYEYSYTVGKNQGIKNDDGSSKTKAKIIYTLVFPINMYECKS